MTQSVSQYILSIASWHTGRQGKKEAIVHRGSLWEILQCTAPTAIRGAIAANTPIRHASKCADETAPKLGLAGPPEGKMHVCAGRGAPARMERRFMGWKSREGEGKRGKHAPKELRK